MQDWGLEKTAEAYPDDKAYAPVGLGVATFWMGAVTLGLAAFVVSDLVSKGSWAPHIVGNNRVVFENDVHGLYDGLALAAILLVISFLMTFAGRTAVKANRKLGGLWRIAFLGVPALMLVLFFIAITLYH
ncbi:MAG TPA: hypothetical protein VG944_20460 [Fimbriimonas sp.]|nr:hypothetical protein [Fimbriimonas sp.]